MKVVFRGIDPGQATGSIVDIDLEGNVVAWLVMPKIVLNVTKVRKKKQEDGTIKSVKNEDGKLTDTDIAALVSWFKKNNYETCKLFIAVEDVQPFQAPIARNTVGYFQKNLGALMALAFMHGSKVFMIPKGWQNEFYAGKADKGKAVKAAKELFPELATIIDEAGANGTGIADAALMAERVRRKYVWVFSQREEQNAKSSGNDDADRKRKRS